MFATLLKEKFAVVNMFCLNIFFPLTLQCYRGVRR
jgi:hypothetical protein